ncbi:MAG: ATP-binding protein [Nitrosopumilus sp.]
MNIQKNFVILSLYFISQTVHGHEAPTRNRNEDEEQYIQKKYAESQELYKQTIQRQQINNKEMSREEKIQAKIDAIRYNQNQIKNLPEHSKYFIKPKSKLLKRLFKKVDEFNKEKITTLPKTVTLEGPPGSGKTSIGIEIAKEVGGILYFQHASEIGGMYAGDGVIYLNILFQKILEDAKGQPGTEGQPIVVLIDEVDAVMKNRKDLGGGSVSADMRSTMLSMLHQIDKLNESNIMIIFTTNRIQDLDPAFKRTGGRMKYLITVDLPSKEELFSALDESLKGHRFKKKEKPNWLLDKMITEKFSYGDIEFLLDEVRELVNENNHPATEDDYQEAMNVTLKRKYKAARLSEEEERRNAEWEERNFQEGKKECIEALEINPDADLDKIIEDRKEKGLGSTRIRPWKKENGAMLRCKTLEKQLMAELAIYHDIFENSTTTIKGNTKGSECSSSQTSEQKHENLTEEGKQLIKEGWNKIEKCRIKAIFHSLSKSIQNKTMNDLNIETEALGSEATLLEKEYIEVSNIFKSYMKTWWGPWNSSQAKRLVCKLKNWENKAYTILNKLESLPMNRKNLNTEKNLRKTIHNEQKIRNDLQKVIDKYSR